MTREELIAECKPRMERGEDIDQLIAFLREAGCDKVPSIAILTKCGLGLAKAKERVHLSPVWEDRRARDDAFHAEAEAVLRTLSD